MSLLVTSDALEDLDLLRAEQAGLNKHFNYTYNLGNYITSYHNIKTLQSRLSNNSLFGNAVFKTSERFPGQTEGQKVLASGGSIDSRSATS